MKWLEKYRNLPRVQRLSIFFGLLIALGTFLIIIGAMFTIKFTPYATYSNKVYGISIKFPAYWKLKHSPAPGSIIIFFSPKPNDTEALTANFNIAYKDLPQSITIDRLSQMIVRQVTGTFGEHIDMTENIPIQLSGRPGYKITFAGYGKDVETPVLYVVAWTNVENRVYILTFAGLQKDYPQYKSKVNAMIRSFKLFPPEPL